jgi:cyclopropane fatty-acyl-phospholipid synthase-like methyltransferase
MNPNQALWEKGDFTRLADNMRASGEAFVERLGVGPETKVLDLGCRRRHHRAAGGAARRARAGCRHRPQSG